MPHAWGDMFFLLVIADGGPVPPSGYCVVPLVIAHQTVFNVQDRLADNTTKDLDCPGVFGRGSHGLGLIARDRP